MKIGYFQGLFTRGYIIRSLCAEWYNPILATARKLISATEPIEAIDHPIFREDARAEALQAPGDHLIFTKKWQLQMVIEWEKIGI